VTGQTSHTQNLHKYQSFSSPRALALIPLGVVFLQVNINVLQVPAHTEITHQSRSMRNYETNARTQSSEANHKRDTMICFPKFRFTTVNPTSPLRNSMGVSLFQLDPLSWVSFNYFPDSTILILSTKGARSRPHKFATAHHNVGS
jgi:hypothetical protein